MKRSNRLILLIGIFLAVVAFGGILLLTTNGGSGGQSTTPTTASVVYTKVDVALGTKLTADMLEPREIQLSQKAPDAFVDTGLVVGKKVARNVAAGTQLTQSDFASNGQIGTLDVPKGERAIAVQVDQVSGVGTVISTGDYVDVVLGVKGPDNFPVITVNANDNSVQPVQGLNATSTKVLLQGVQVLGTLLPPPTAAQTQQSTDNGNGNGQQQGTALNGQTEIVILAVTAQQAEVIKFAQLSGDQAITLVLRSPDDFRDATGKPVIPATDPTSGVILKTLVDQYGVLPPQLVETVLPARVRK